jgi:hypothetical protein
MATFSPAVGLFAVVFLVAFGLVASGIAAEFPREVSTPTLLRELRPAAAPENCSAATLTNLSTTPARVQATPLAVEWFTATASNACGAPVTGNVTYSWWLSSVSLGTLSSSVGTTTAYTACVAPMDGTLHLKATSAGVTRYANASISVSTRSSGSNPPPSSGGTLGAPPAPGGAAIPWWGIGATVALFGGAAVVLVVGLRKEE